MHEEVRKLADEGNIKRLRYVFSDSLDVDPSFCEYEDDFRYCQEKGIFEPYAERTPLRSESSAWDAAYWTALKKDLLANLSVKRLNHMREVAKVLFKARLRPAEAPSPAPAAQPVENVTPERSYTVKKLAPEDDPEKKQQRELEEKRRKFAENETKKEAARQTVVMRPVTHTVSTRRAAPSKKALGVPAWMLLLLFVAAVIVIYLILR